MLTVFQNALAALGHSVRFNGVVWELSANPDRAGEFGEIPEADYAVADAAVLAAYAAGERRPEVLGVFELPGIRTEGVLR